LNKQKHERRKSVCLWWWKVK